MFINAKSMQTPYSSATGFKRIQECSGVPALLKATSIKPKMGILCPSNSSSSEMTPKGKDSKIYHTTQGLRSLWMSEKLRVFRRTCMIY